MVSDGDSIDTHFYDWVIIAARLGHITEVKDIFFLDFQLFEEVGHTEDFVHAWSNGVNRGGAADFVVKFRSEFFTAGDDLFAFLAIGIPSVFGFGAGFLAEGRESDLGEAVFDDLVACGEFILFPVAEFTRSLFDGLADFLNLFVG